MIETALVFDDNGKILYWHEPPGRNGGALPDSRALWDVLWENRDHLGGVAHTHPWDGKAWPSTTDMTTFDAVERGLGKQLLWPVVTFTDIVYIVRNPLYGDMGTPFKWVPANPKYLTFEIEGIEELRERSRK